MTQAKKAPGGAGTFLRFAWQQLTGGTRLRESFAGLANFANIEAALRRLPDAERPQIASLAVGATDAGWRRTGVSLRAGQSFSIFADGTIWISKAMSVGATPGTALWLRIAGKAPLNKMQGGATTFVAWAGGELELCLKPPGEWLNESGTFDPAVARTGATGEIEAIIAVWQGKPALAALAGDPALKGILPAEPAAPPPGWSYLWRLGGGSIYGASQDAGKPCIHVHTHGDVGILQYPLEAPLGADATLEWRWRIARLPSALPEHIQPTHDYLSIAVEFENGQDLTYYWSAELPVDTVFKCPLPWWAERETHWVVRSGPKDLGQWQSEKRTLRPDYQQAIPGAVPSKIVRVWLIANSVFQRGHGEATFADIVLTSAGVRHQIV